MKQRFVRVLGIAGIVGLLVAGAVEAQEDQESRWNVSLETRAQVGYSSAGEGDLAYGGLFPKVSFFVKDRLRIDSGIGLGFNEGDDVRLNLFPGVRYYYLQPENRRFRLNGGLDLGFGLFYTPTRSRFDVGPEGNFVVTPQDELLTLRAVPLELEYWAHRKGAFTLGFDYGATLLEGGELDGEGLGITGGFRWRF